jgi:hypothetical protein
MSAPTKHDPWWASAWGRVVLYPVPLVAAWIAEQRISDEICRHDKSVEDGAVAIEPKVPLDRLEGLLANGLELKRSLESKATLHMGGVGVILGLVSGWSTSSGGSACVEWTTRIGLALAMTCFFAAAWAAYAVVRARPWSRATLRWESEIASQASPDVTRVDQVAWCVKKNELTCSILSNYLNAAHRHTLAGLGFLFLALIIRVIS